MNPPARPNDKDETAISAPDQKGASASGESTDAGGPGDVTVVRAAPAGATVPDLSEGNNFGRYELLGEIARGGMGVVYRARQHGLDRTVALKMILGTGMNHESAQRFMQEARAAAALDHPNVVPIYDIGEIGDRPYFTMALIDGPNLRGHVDALGTVPIPLAIALFAQTVAGVAHAHQHGIIHRDLKPANVLIDKDGRPRVTDFGLAKRATTESQLTVTGQVVGTPSYMAPEQARDSKDVGPPADVYALGAILYFLLTGKPPFQGESFTDLLIKVVQDPPVPPSQVRTDVPADLEALCLRCLAKAPGERYADATALGEALAPIADQHLPPSASLTPSLGRIGSRPSTPAVGSVPDLVPTINSGPAVARSPAWAPAEPPAPPANRKPLLFGLVAATVLLIAAIAYLATREPKKADEVAKQDPPPAGPPALPPGPPPKLPFPPVGKGPEIVPPKIVPNVGPNDGDKLAWPAPSRADFGLKVDLEADGLKKEGDGTYRMIAGSELDVLVTAAKDCRVSIWVVETNGEMTRLFPNEYESDDRLAAGQKRVIPGKNGGKFEMTPTEGAGWDRLCVLATTGDRVVFPAGVKRNQFTAYASEADRERVVSTIRGIVLKKPATAGASADEVHEAEIRFRVSK